MKLNQNDTGSNEITTAEAQFYRALDRDADVDYGMGEMNYDTINDNRLPDGPVNFRTRTLDIDEILGYDQATISRSKHDQVKKVRYELPYLQIASPPNKVVALQLAQNVAQDVDLSSAALIRVTASASANLFTDFRGTAIVPGAGVQLVEGSALLSSGAGFLIHTENNNMVSLITPDAAGCYCSVEMWSVVV